MMQEQLNELKRRLIEVDNLESAAALLSWDQSTYMPPGGARARARQMATLRQLAHEKFTDPAIGRLLDDLEVHARDLPHDSDEASLIRVTRRDYEKAIEVPPSFMARFSSHSAESYEAWAKARPADDFAAVEDNLRKTLDLSREYANFFPGYDHIADPLIDRADEGMEAATISQLFAELRQELVPLVETITDQPPIDDDCLHRPFPAEQQTAFGLEVIKRFGYDFERGRQDETRHPFTTKFSLGDVRITTRVNENDLSEALFSTLHEAGHAIYEQGISMDLEGTPLASGTSAGVHESQSRLWENVVGRSRGLWRFFYPRLQALFSDQLGSVSLEDFYRAINKVAPSLIRTDADEVTYNLHVLMRFDLELALLEGNLDVGDLPEAWRERLKADLGVAPPDHRNGVLQDVHWYAGSIGGAFQGYTLGNILSAQFYQCALDTHPEIPDQIEEGRFDTLHAWLTDNVYRHGRKFLPAELIQRVTGGPIQIEPYIQYLRSKYTELYGL